MRTLVVDSASAGEVLVRVPDGGLHRPGASGTWLPTAALVVEIGSDPPPHGPA